MASCFMDTPWHRMVVVVDDDDDDDNEDDDEEVFCGGASEPFLSMANTY